MGSFQSLWLPGWMTAIATLGIILAAAYFLWTLQRMFFGTLWSRTQIVGQLTDLDARERLMLIPLAALALLLGLFPNVLFNLTNSTIAQWIQRFSVE
jgi:NADH-quinone oxidoreductase subunit M